MVKKLFLFITFIYSICATQPKLQIVSITSELVPFKQIRKPGPQMTYRESPTIIFTLTIINKGDSVFFDPIFIGIASEDDITRNHYSHGQNTALSQAIKIDSSAQISVSILDRIKYGTKLRFYLWSNIDSLKLHKLPKIEEAATYYDYVYNK